MQQILVRVPTSVRVAVLGSVVLLTLWETLRYRVSIRTNRRGTHKSNALSPHWLSLSEWSKSRRNPWFPLDADRRGAKSASHQRRTQTDATSLSSSPAMASSCRVLRRGQHRSHRLLLVSPPRAQASLPSPPCGAVVAMQRHVDHRGSTKRKTCFACGHT